MLPRSLFGTNHEAYIEYVCTRSVPEAVAELERMARDDGFVEIAVDWLRAAMWFVQRGGWDANVVGTLMLDMLEQHPVEEFRELVENLSAFVRRDCSPEVRRRLLGWLERAEPGDGLVVGRAMLGFLAETRTREALAAYAALATRMLDTNGGVLRHRSFGPLAFWILDVVRYHAPSYIGTALRYLAASEGVWTVLYVDSAESSDIFWPAVERYLEDGGDEALIGDVIGAPAVAGSVSRQWLFTPVSEPAFPRAQRALLRALCEGRVSSNRLDFEKAISVSPPPVHLDPQCWAPLAEALRTASFDDQYPDGCLNAWAEYCTYEWFRVHGMQRSMELIQLAGHTRLQAGIRRALERRLATTPSNVQSLARRILDEQVDAVVRPALSALATPDAAFELDEGVVERVRLELERFVNLPWLHRVGGLDVGRLLAGCHIVSFDCLPHSDKVCLEPPRLLFDRDSLIGLLELLPTRDTLLGALVYALHELVHIPQGLQAMRTVSKLREAGAETTLLHLDLAADHVTALLLQDLYPARTLTDLKRFEGELLEVFPIGRFHTPGSAERKMRRLVSLRADYILRRERLLEDELGYVFVDFGTGGGPIAFMSSGPPHRVVHVGELSRSSAEQLRTSARNLALADVDSIIEGALSALAGRELAP